MTEKKTRREFLGDSARIFTGIGITAGAALTNAGNASGQTASNPIVTENLQPGTSDWEITNPALDGQIYGYASKMAVKKGSTIDFYVSTPEPQFYGEIFRLGWYGGLGGRRMTDTYTFSGGVHPVPAPDPTTGLVDCNWPSLGSVYIPPEWTNGLYVAKLTSATTGSQSYIPFVVYDERRADYVFQIPFTTWQAYNNFGGKSLYDFNSSNQRRAYRVSFNRPLAQGWGAGYLIAWELCMLRFLEREGFDVNYISDYETHTSTTILQNYKCVIVAGHDEYWSMQMRQNFDRAVTNRVNMAFFGANCAFWQVRFDASPYSTAPIMTCYKSAALDPFYAVRTKRKFTTVLFKDPIVAMPEGKLMGVEYRDYDASADIVIENPSHWVFAGTGARAGTRLPGLVGVEYDTITANSPSNIVRLAHSPVTGAEAGPGYADMTIFTAPSGAQIFSAGSIVWPNGLDSYNTKFSLPNLVNPIAQRVTKNVLNRFAGR